MRLFFALPLPAPALDAAAAAQAAMRAAAGEGARIAWPPREQLHVTVAFLGDQASAEPAIAAARAACAGRAGFDLSLDGAGAFPNPRRPQTLWLGLAAGSAALTALAEALRPALVAQGIALEDRPLHPHLTVARVKADGARAAGAALRAAPRSEVCRFHAGALVLFESVLGAGPAVHKRVAEFPLDAAATSPAAS